MKAIIVAAGMGRRLRPYTDDRPKCLVEVNGNWEEFYDRTVEIPATEGRHDLVLEMTTEIDFPFPDQERDDATVDETTVCVRVPDR